MPEKNLTSEIAQLRRQASVAPTLADQQSLMLQAEKLVTAQRQAHEADTGFQVSGAVVRDTLVPGAVHELNTGASDWLLDVHTASVDPATAHNEMVAQASLWFNRTPDEIKSYPEEFAEQARNLAHRHASQFADLTDQSERVFLDEVHRLRAQALRSGSITEAADDPIDPHVGGFHFDAVHHVADAAEEEQEQQHPQDNTHTQHGPADDIYHKFKNGTDVDGLQAANQQAIEQGMPREGASTVPQVSLPQDQFSSLMYDTRLAPGATDSNRAPALQEMKDYKGWDGASVVPPNDNHANEMNDNTSGIQDASEGNAVTQSGFPITSSIYKESKMDRATQEMRDREKAISDAQSMGAGILRPIDAGTGTRATCPTCGGHGKVAVRSLNPKEAYSGLPQVDQIMDPADDAPAPTPLPPQVAWPIEGGGWGPAAAPQHIQEANSQIAERDAKSPLLSGQASRRTANGRDNSGWMGDMGAKGPDYPGNSTPAYDGSNNLGQPDPVYGYGGDETNRPLKPNGAMEDDDYSNGIGMNWQPGQPTQYDSGQESVSPTLNTGQPNSMGFTGQFHPDPYVASAQRELLRQQQLIRERTAQLAGR